MSTSDKASQASVSTSVGSAKQAGGSGPRSGRPVALVTGASGGIGFDIARELAARGYDLVLIARNASKLNVAAEELSQQHAVEVLCLPLDLASRNAADQVADEVMRRGLQLEVLVNNAGFGLYGRHDATLLSDEQQMIDVNITALTRLTKRLLPHLLERRRARILNVASTAAFQPGPLMAVYYATKAYVLSYSEALAQELQGSVVTVTALCPGPTASGFQERASMRQSALVSGRRLPSASEVARYGVQAMMAGRRVAVPGVMNKLLVQSLRFTPRWLVTRLVERMSRPVTV